MQRQTYTEGSPWEPIVGYARAVKIGNIIEISGTTASVNGEVVGKGDVYEQTKCILQKFEKSIAGIRRINERCGANENFLYGYSSMGSHRKSTWRILLRN
jgi:enamine deaminase RidA (YjgF/YER057c/UK114 family)